MRNESYREIFDSTFHRRLEDWTEPRSGHTEIRQMLEIIDDASKVASAVTVAVFEGARINLVVSGQFYGGFKSLILSPGKTLHAQTNLVHGRDRRGHGHGYLSACKR